ncbi:MAG: hypothetical protein Q4C61_11475 [Lachnospiraceae bacterium]|nr:hypothetical protein [Lachnospiraceae bacterium]
MIPIRFSVAKAEINYYNKGGTSLEGRIFDVEMQKRDWGNIPEDCDERLKHLHSIVEKIKAGGQMGVNYMKMEERDRQLREDGAKEKLLSQIGKKLEKGKTIEEIADALEEEPAAIKELVQELRYQE